MTLPSFGAFYTSFFGDARAAEEESENEAVALLRRKKLAEQVQQARHLEDLSKFVGWKEYVGLLEARLSQMQRDLENATSETMRGMQSEIKVLRFALDVVPNTVRGAEAARKELEE